jgi:hypothetical protein
MESVVAPLWNAISRFLDALPDESETAWVYRTAEKDYVAVVPVVTFCRDDEMVIPQGFEWSSIHVTAESGVLQVV